MFKFRPCFAEQANFNLQLNTSSPGSTVMVCVILLQPPEETKLLAARDGDVHVSVPATFLHSAFGNNWQQAGFKVQLSVFKDGTCIAGRRVAAEQAWPCAADDIASQC
jgi:hypothetical protein